MARPGHPPHPDAGAEILLARPGPRRLLGRQRADRHPRRAGRLRRLGRGGLRGMVGARCPAADGRVRGRPGAGPRRRPDPGVSRPSRADWGAVDRGLRDAALAAGYPWNPDLNAAEGEGVSCYPYNVSDGKRVSANDAYLEPARGPPEPRDPRRRACRSRARSRRPRHAASASASPECGWTDIAAREVLLCAGAIHSPAILMRSGLGPAAALPALGIARRPRHAGSRPTLHGPFVHENEPDLKPEYVARDRDARHTNCCVTYTSGLARRRPAGHDHDRLQPPCSGRGRDAGTRPAASASASTTLSRAAVCALSRADPDANPEVDENMLDDERDLVRMRDGDAPPRTRCPATPRWLVLAERITIGETGPRLRRGHGAAAAANSTRSCSTSAPTASMPPAPAA